jgi:hypothetical protein
MTAGLMGGLWADATCAIAGTCIYHVWRCGCADADVVLLLPQLFPCNLCALRCITCGSLNRLAAVHVFSVGLCSVAAAHAAFDFFCVVACRQHSATTVGLREDCVHLCSFCVSSRAPFGVSGLLWLSCLKVWTGDTGAGTCCCHLTMSEEVIACYTASGSGVYTYSTCTHVIS